MSHDATAGFDERLQTAVLEALRRVPHLDESRIVATVDCGIATLAGFVGDYGEKLAAESVAESVPGIRAVTSHLSIVGDTYGSLEDVSIAAAALQSLQLEPGLPGERIKLRVEQGWVTLDGVVETEEQRQLARRAVRHTSGVRGLSNLIKVSYGAPGRRLPDSPVSGERTSFPRSTD